MRCTISRESTFPRSFCWFQEHYKAHLVVHPSAQLLWDEPKFGRTHLRDRTRPCNPTRLKFEHIGDDQSITRTKCFASTHFRVVRYWPLDPFGRTRTRCVPNRKKSLRLWVARWRQAAIFILVSLRKNFFDRSTTTHPAAMSKKAQLRGSGARPQSPFKDVIHIPSNRIPRTGDLMGELRRTPDLIRDLHNLRMPLSPDEKVERLSLLVLTAKIGLSGVVDLHAPWMATSEFARRIVESLSPFTWQSQHSFPPRAQSEFLHLHPSLMDVIFEGLWSLLPNRWILGPHLSEYERGHPIPLNKKQKLTLNDIGIEQLGLPARLEESLRNWTNTIREAERLLQDNEGPFIFPGRKLQRLSGYFTGHAISEYKKIHVGEIEPSAEHLEWTMWGLQRLADSTKSPIPGFPGLTHNHWGRKDSGAKSPIIRRTFSLVF